MMQNKGSGHIFSKHVKNTHLQGGESIQIKGVNFRVVFPLKMRTTEGGKTNMSGEILSCKMKE